MPDADDIQIDLEQVADFSTGTDDHGELDEARVEIIPTLAHVDAPPLDPVAALEAVRRRDLLLEKLRKAATSTRVGQTTAFIELVTRVQQLCEAVPEKREQVAIMTRDWRISRAEAHRLLRLQGLSDKTKKLYVEASVTPEMIVALQKSMPIIREDAHLLISAGRVLHTTDLARMRNRRNAADPNVRRAKQDRKMRAQMVKAGVGQLNAFKSRLERMVRFLAKGYVINWDRRERRMEFLRAAAMSSARVLLGEFDALFSADLPAIKDWFSVRPGDCASHLAKVRLGLERMAHGDFLLSEYSYNDWGPINLALVQALAWLADVDVSHLPVEWPSDAGRDEALGDEFEGCSPPTETKPLTSLEICSGAGGAAIGLHAAGFKSVGLVERNRYAVQTLLANPALGPVFYRDVLEKNFTPYIGRVDLFAGGVPCQPHSTLGQQAGENDERDLFDAAVSIIRKVRPRAVMLENVDGFGHRQNHVYRARIFAKLREAGYDAELFAISASEYGLAQARPRLMLVAMRDGLLSRFKMPPVLTAKPVTLGEALYDLMAENGWEGVGTWARSANLPGPTIVGGSEKSGGQGFSSKLQLKDWAPCRINARRIEPTAPGRDAPEDHIPGLTLRMGARLQGFPESWIFKGTKREQRRQIANALPPIMACAVGLAVREALTGEPVDYAAELAQWRIEAVGRTKRRSADVEATMAEMRLPQGTAAALGLGDAISSIRPESQGLEGLKGIIDPSGIKLVRRYCKASRPNRAAMDISELSEVMRGLLSMLDKKAFKALAKASDWAIRRCIDGKAHGIDGVPYVVTPAVLPTA